MKIFKKWNEESINSFVFFLGKDVILQKRRVRRLYSEFQKNGDIDLLKQYNTQVGASMKAYSIYEIAKTHFNLDSISRKNKNNE